MPGTWPNPLIDSPDAAHNHSLYFSMSIGADTCPQLPWCDTYDRIPTYVLQHVKKPPSVNHACHIWHIPNVHYVDMYKSYLLWWNQNMASGLAKSTAPLSQSLPICREWNEMPKNCPSGNQHLQQKPFGTLIGFRQPVPLCFPKHLKQKPIVMWHCVDPWQITGLSLSNAEHAL